MTPPFHGKALIVVGDAAETLDTLYPYYRLFVFFNVPFSSRAAGGFPSKLPAASGSTNRLKP